MMTIANGTQMMPACGSRSMRMSNFMPAAMCMSAAACAIIIQTGVQTSVSLFVLYIVPFLLVGLVVLLSLLLICLIGLVRLGSLVGLKIERIARQARGE